MRAVAPVVCKLKDGARTGQAIVEFDIPELTAAEAPIGLETNHDVSRIVYRVWDNRIWTQSTQLVDPRATILQRPDEFRRAFLEQMGPLSPTARAARSALLQPGATVPVGSEDVEGSLVHCAVADRAARTILIDGTPFVQSHGPVLQIVFFPETPRAFASWSSWWWGMDPQQRLTGFDPNDIELAREYARSRGSADDLDFSLSESMPQGYLPHSGLDHVASAVEAAGWLALEAFSTKRMSSLPRETAELACEFRDEIVRRHPDGYADLNGFGRYSWAREADTVVVPEAGRLADLLERAIETPEIKLDVWQRCRLEGALARERFMRARSPETTPAADVDALEIDMPGVRR